MLVRVEPDPIRIEAMELIPHAPTLLAARVLLDQYHGALSSTLDALRKEIEHGSDWAGAEKALERLLSTARFGRGLHEYTRIVIAGRPNVGKSTLANALLRFDRIIVHHAPGTTRDTIEELFSIKGVPFLLVDTAGMREARSAVEEEGVQRGREELHRADVVLLVFDGAAPLQQEDRELLDARLPAQVIPVLNKCDLPRIVNQQEVSAKLGATPIEIAALHDTDIETLEERILEAAYPVRPRPGDAVIFTERQESRIGALLQAVRQRNVQEAVRLSLNIIL